ncbi:MAG: hypothetical protein R6U78_09960 [Bacteroidales bacterium]
MMWRCWPDWWKKRVKLYNTYVCVTGDGPVARARKLHPFPHARKGLGGPETEDEHIFRSEYGIHICLRVIYGLGLEAESQPKVHKGNW